MVKNKVAAPFQNAEFDIIYGKGISREGDLLDLAVARNIVDKSGAWYSYKGERIGQGRENVRQFLIKNTDVTSKIETKLRQELGLIPDAEPATPAKSDASDDKGKSREKAKESERQPTAH